MSSQPQNAQSATAPYDTHEPNLRFIGALTGLIVLALIVLLLALQAYFDRLWEREVYVKVLAPESETLREVRAREEQQLHRYTYLDRQRGTVQLPIERAMELLIEEARQGKLFYPTTPAPVVAEIRAGEQGAPQTKAGTGELDQ